jgi:hypothetical protein
MRTIYAYVKHMPGHKDSKGDPASWVIIDHDDGHIISSHKTEEAAKEHLQQMHAHKSSVPLKNKLGFISQQKEKEIIVWIRLQPNMDKFEILDFIKNKFHLDDEHAETCYYKALPNGLSSTEFMQAKEIGKKLETTPLDSSSIDTLLNNCIRTVVLTSDSDSDLVSDFISLTSDVIETEIPKN